MVTDRKDTPATCKGPTEANRNSMGQLGVGIDWGINWKAVESTRTHTLALFSSAAISLRTAAEEGWALAPAPRRGRRL